jgi:hypothetical protein
MACCVTVFTQPTTKRHPRIAQLALHTPFRTAYRVAFARSLIAPAIAVTFVTPFADKASHVTAPAVNAAFRAAPLCISASEPDGQYRAQQVADQAALRMHMREIAHGSHAMGPRGFAS